MQLTEVVIYNTPNSVFLTPRDNVKKSALVVVSTENGLEYGVVKGNKNVKQKDVKIVEFVRIANKDDYAKKCENCKFVQKLLPEVKKEAKKLGLDMKIGFLSTNLERSKLFVHYTADNRVDFRELVKTLGSRYKTRIEMCQIGNRDETKVVGAIGPCGREVCCKLHLCDFNKVSIKMAKNQNIALNPTKINGMCGRLLCCLKYEDDVYEEAKKRMPKIGMEATTPDGKGKVKSIDVLRETVGVEFKKQDDSTEIKTFKLEEIKFGQKKKNEKN